MTTISRFRTKLLSCPLPLLARHTTNYLVAAAANYGGHAAILSYIHKSSVVRQNVPFMLLLHRQRHQQCYHATRTTTTTTTPPSFLIPMAKKIKRAGQALAAILIFSVVQGVMLLHKYRYDARGQLKYPDGLTLGKEDYMEDADQEVDGEVDITSADDDGRGMENSFSILDSLLPYIVTEEAGRDTPTKNQISFPLPAMPSSLLRKLDSAKHSDNKDPIRVLVIGDSLAIGVGCIEQFVAAKSHLLSPSLIENTEANNYRRQGPVFPQVLARTLSRHFQLPVQWRSAGVDGGDVDDIRAFCLDVVKQECAAQGVDIVVILFGMNDLKRLLPGNPFRHLFGTTTQDMGGMSQFRNGVDMLLSDIRSHAPGAVVVLPELPFQTNIFPLGLMMDGLLGVWERLKKMVVKGRSNAMYLELDAKEISDLYSNKKSYGNLQKALIDEHGLSMIEDCDDVEDDPLFSPDGVHPNKKLYQKWAEIVGRKIYVRVRQQMGSLDKCRHNAKV